MCLAGMLVRRDVVAFALAGIRGRALTARQGAGLDRSSAHHADLPVPVVTVAPAAPAQDAELAALRGMGTVGVRVRDPLAGSLDGLAHIAISTYGCAVITNAVAPESGAGRSWVRQVTTLTQMVQWCQFTVSSLSRSASPG